MMIEDLESDGESSLNVNCNVVSVLPHEYDQVMEVENSAEVDGAEMARHKPVCYYILNNGVIRWQNRLLNTGLRFLFGNIAVSKSRHRLFFYPTMERVKRIENTFSRFLTKGVRLWTEKVLAPFPSVVFHGILGTCSFLKITFVFVF